MFIKYIKSFFVYTKPSYQVTAIETVKKERDMSNSEKKQNKVIKKVSFRKTTQTPPVSNKKNFSNKYSGSGRLSIWV